MFFSLLVAMLLPFKASAALMNLGPSFADGRGPASQSNSGGNLPVESLGEIKNGIISIGAERTISNYFPVEIDLSNFHLGSRPNKNNQNHLLTFETA